jgi:predicted nucleic acid-binding Zn ribbon protein
MSGPKKKPEVIGDVLGAVLRETGIADRVDQARVVPDWERLVGPQIAAVTEPRSISVDGTLFVGVKTNAWMTELSLLEPELLRSLNVQKSHAPIKRIRWLLRR